MNLRKKGIWFDDMLTSPSDIHIRPLKRPEVLYKSLMLSTFFHWLLMASWSNRRFLVISREPIPNPRNPELCFHLTSREKRRIGHSLLGQRVRDLWFDRTWNAPCSKLRTTSHDPHASSCLQLGSKKPFFSDAHIWAKRKTSVHRALNIYYRTDNKAIWPEKIQTSDIIPSFNYYSHCATDSIEKMI